MQVKIEKLDHFGRGITFIDGKICFVIDALPGEFVKIKIIKETKKYFLASVIEYISCSSSRILEKCPYAKRCGGCDGQHMSFSFENDWKREKVEELLWKFAHLDKSIVREVTFLEKDGYRNKITLHGANHQLGYYGKGKSEFILVSDCKLANQRIRDLFPYLFSAAKKNDISEVVIRSSNDSSKIMVKLVGNISSYDDLLDKVDVLVVNDKVVTKEDSILTTVGKRKYRVSIDSFFQVNWMLTEKLYDEVRQVVLRERPRRVLDLYCGTGTIGIYISDSVEEVIGIDCSKDGIYNANQNKKLNRVTNISFLCDRVENVIDSLEGEIDFIIVDPPRAGLDKKTIAHIKRMFPKHIVYISCDPVTLARDLNCLTEIYNVEWVKPYNMFPRTYHVEVVCCLSRKERSGNINE